MPANNDRVKLNTSLNWKILKEEYNLEKAIMDRIKEISETLPEIRRISVNNNLITKAKEGEIYNKNLKIREFNIGEMVSKRKEVVQNKFDAVWDGPYKVINRNTRGTYVLMDHDSKVDTVHGDRLRKFYPNLSLHQQLISSTTNEGTIQSPKSIQSERGVGGDSSKVYVEEEVDGSKVYVAEEGNSSKVQFASKILVVSLVCSTINEGAKNKHSIQQSLSV
ncbi:hypothetical protein BB558_002803 [Smittium angustum]|uniref:Integrase zinc-binding domain-containing protein n=1 Tax=Smittium angustum TaxID=133377 RepID=A0A2U1J817_SMIAN|nr:hypothetical protein BB558_002803 [Smittium angustum]